MDTVTATATELNLMDGVTATTAELNTAADLSAQGGMVKVKKHAIVGTPDGTEEDSGWNLPVKSIVLGVWVDVTTLEATGTTKTMDVGLLTGESGGDPNGFLAAISCAAAGVIRGVLVPEPHVCNGTAVSLTYTASANDWAEFVGDIYVIYMEIG